MGRIVLRGTRDNPKVYADYYDVDGTRRTRLLRGTRTKPDGRRLLAEIEARVAAGKPGLAVDEAKPPPAPGEAICGPLIDEWLSGLSNRNAKDDRTRVKRDVRPAWDQVSLAEAQRVSRVMRWLDQLKQSGLSGQSQRHALNAFSRFMAWAVERGLAEVNPVRMVPAGKRPQAAPKKADAPWLSDEGTFAKIMAAMPSPISLMFWLGNRSGLRLGEICGLVLEDFAWLTDGIIRVSHSYGGRLKEDKGNGPPKTKWVPAAFEAQAVLGPWLTARRALGAGPSDLVFPRAGKSGWGGYTKEIIEEEWLKIVATFDLKLTFYEATRHSFVSRNLANGVPVDEISAALGHSSPVVTTRFYARFVRKSFSAAIRGEPSTSHSAGT